MGRWSRVERDPRLPSAGADSRPTADPNAVVAEADEPGEWLVRGVHAAGPVLVALALALRPIDLPGDVKSPLLATLSIVNSFALSWRLVTRTPSDWPM